MVRRFRGTRLAPQPSVDALLDRFRFARDPRICMQRRAAARRCTFGVLRPTVLLPEDLATGDGAVSAGVGARTGAHPAEGLPAEDRCLTVCLCLYWWHPLVWLMAVACRPRYGAGL